jgi:outer membrane protein W
MDTVAARQKRTRERYPHSILDFHIGVWDSTDGDSGIETHYTYDPITGEQLSDVSLSGIGGFFAYTHRLDRRFAWEFSIGGFTQAEMVTSSKFKYTSIYRDYYHQVTLVPISFSAFFYPFAIDFPLQPYVCGGIGPYGGVESITEENFWNGSEPINVNILIALGRFLGGGVDFFLNKHFGFNIDFRYQQVEFHKQIGGMKKYSGPQLTWGFKVAF